MSKDLLNEIEKLKNENSALVNELNKTDQNRIAQSKLLDNSPFIVWSVNTKFEYTYTSPVFSKQLEFFSGLKPVIGQNMLDSFIADDRDIWKDRLERAVLGEHLVLDDKVPFPDGFKYYKTHVFPIFNKNIISGVQINCIEITKAIEAEQKEITSLRRVQKTLQMLQDMYYEVELDGTIIEVSPAVTKLYGFTPEQLIGKNIQILYSKPEERESFLEVILKAGSVTDYIINFKDKNNVVKKLSVNASIIYNDEKEAVSIAGIIKDISEIEKIHNDLIWLQGAINQSPVSIIITNTNGKIEYTNPFFTKATGYTKDEVIGRNPSLLKSGEQSEEFYKELWNNISNGKIWEGEFHNKRKDGSLFWEKASISPVWNKTGEIINYIAIKEDVSQQKQNEEKLRKLKEFYDRIIRTMHEGILVEDTDGTILYTNPSISKITGYSQQELLGQSWEMLISLEHQKIVKEANQRRQDKLSDSYEIKILTKDGNSIPLLVSGTPIHEDGEYKGLVAVFSDIKELKTNEKRLKKALKQAKLSDKLKSSFLANMSHEIRTPMNAVLGFAEILRTEQKIDDETRTEYFDIIENKGKELLQIISDIIDISKIESKVISIKNNEFELNEFLRNIHTIFEREHLNGEKPPLLKCAHQFQDNKTLITTDKIRLNQVFQNLLYNAYKFTTKGEIEFGYSEIKSEIEFFVRDTGIGISKEDQKIIFERFRQTEDNYTRSFGGTGLGLHICKKLIKLLGGKIWVESKPNKGSIFYFTIPKTK